MASLEMEHRGAYILARLSGAIGIDDLKHVVAATDFCKEKECAKILLDGAKASFGLGYADRVALGLELAKIFPLGMRLGVIVKAEHAAEGKPFRMAVQNRALNIRFFEDPKEAVAWAAQ
ncbi:hypothetical protein HYR69_10860 [Candidatus Sumerlaeota bacterium]|nr:hypothetical protein [Candidatus Sumerlaeota bacterium]